MSLGHKVVFSESIGPGRSGATSRLSAADSHSGDILQQVGVSCMHTATIKYQAYNIAMDKKISSILAVRRSWQIN
jgi:hypothetical protein